MRRTFFFIVAVCLATSSFASIPRASALDLSSPPFDPLPETRIRVSADLAPFERPAGSELTRALRQGYGQASTTNASGLGRFLSVDPTWESADLGRPQSWNRYAYVRNNPVNMTDPDGKIPILVQVLVELATDFVTDGNPANVGADNPPRSQAEFDQRVKEGRAIRASEQYAKLDQPGGPKRGSAGGPGAGKKFDEKTREAARAQSDNKCVFCSTETTRTPGPNQSNIDHAIAKARGGNNTLENAQNACRTCNLKKAVKDTVEYLAKLLF